MAPAKGPFCWLVVPVSVPIDDHGAVTAVVIPATMQATIMTIELRTGAAELTAVAVVAVHVPVATDAHAELFGAGDCGRRNSHCRKTCDNQSELFHHVSSNEQNKLTSKGDVP